MSAVLSPQAVTITPRVLNGRQSFSLDRHGTLATDDGATLHRPLRDTTSVPPEPPQDGAYATATELAALRVVCEPLVSLECDITAADEAWRSARAAGERDGLSELASKFEAAKLKREPSRGSVARAASNTIEAAARRAGARYRAAALEVAAAAAELEALATLRDEIENTTNTFDPLSVWRSASALIAPPHHLRPPGWSVTPDPWGRDCYWTPAAAGHAEEVRRVKAAMRAELGKATNGTGWPFA